MKNLFARIRKLGIRGAARHYEDALFRRVSLNYRQNPHRFEHMSAQSRVYHLLKDLVLSRADRVSKAIDRLLTDQHDIALDELEEFDVRLLDPRRITKDSIVYAFGVSGHIETEELVAQRFTCRVFMFDPTPPALAFISSRTLDPLLVFDPIGVWTKTGPMRFYVDRRPQVKNLSVVNMYHTDTFVEAQCLTLEDIMKRHHHTHIDVLKMDIEGSALPVVLHMITHTSIRPDQIVCSLERPHFVFNATFSEVANYISQKAKLFKALRRAGYRVVTYHVGDFTALRIHGQDGKGSLGN